jgi:xylulokinase
VSIRVIHATGGAAANREVLQVMADVFQAEVRQFGAGNAACLGAALRAWHADAAQSGRAVPWTDIVKRGVGRPVATVQPNPEAAVPSRAMVDSWRSGLGAVL